MARYRKFHSKYSLDKKHQSLSDGDTIWEKDWSTVRGPIIGNFGANAKRKYTDGNFTFVTSNIPSPEKKHTIANEGNVYTYEQVSGATRSETINNKQPEYNSNDLRSYVYFGSAYELVKNSIENIVKNFPPKMYTDHSPLEIPPLPGDMDHDITTASDKDGNSLYTLTNPFNVDFISQNPSLNDENAMHYMSLSYPFYKVKTYKEGKVDCEYNIDSIEIELVGDKIGDCEEEKETWITIEMTPLYSAAGVEIIGDSDDFSGFSPIVNSNEMYAKWKPLTDDEEFSVGKYIINYATTNDGTAALLWERSTSIDFNPNADISIPCWENYDNYISNKPPLNYINFKKTDKPTQDNLMCCFCIAPTYRLFPNKSSGGYFGNVNIEQPFDYEHEPNVNNTIIISECPHCSLFPNHNVRIMSYLDCFLPNTFNKFNGRGIFHWHCNFGYYDDNNTLQYAKDMGGGIRTGAYLDEIRNGALTLFAKVSDFDDVINYKTPNGLNVFNTSSYIRSEYFSDTNDGVWRCFIPILNHDNPEVANYLNNFKTSNITPRQMLYSKEVQSYKFNIYIDNTLISSIFSQDEFDAFAKIEDNKCNLIGPTPTKGIYMINDNSVYIPLMDKNDINPRKFTKYTNIDIVKYSGVKFIKIQ